MTKKNTSKTAVSLKTSEVDSLLGIHKEGDRLVLGGSQYIAADAALNARLLGNTAKAEAAKKAKVYKAIVSANTKAKVGSPAFDSDRKRVNKAIAASLKDRGIKYNPDSLKVVFARMARAAGWTASSGKAGKVWTVTPSTVWAKIPLILAEMKKRCDKAAYAEQVKKIAAIL